MSLDFSLSRSRSCTLPSLTRYERQGADLHGRPSDIEQRCRDRVIDQVGIVICVALVVQQHAWCADTEKEEEINEDKQGADGVPLREQRDAEATKRSTMSKSNSFTKKAVPWRDRRSRCVPCILSPDAADQNRRSHM